MRKQILININGGLGKNIMATAFVEAVKKHYPDRQIILTTAHKDAWKNNPHIDKTFLFGEMLDFYANEIVGNDTISMRLEPYLDADHIYQRKNLIEIWCNLNKIKYDGEQPKLYFTEEENEAVKNKLPQDKPLFFIQTNGGAEGQRLPISWSRDLPLTISEQVVDKMIDKGYEPIHLCREDQLRLSNAKRFEGNIREAMCAIQFSKKRLFIDSFASHTAAALGLKSVVTWISNSPVVFGYKENTNLLPETKKEFRHRINSFLEEYDISGDISQCPYNIEKIFSVNKIVESLDNL